MKLCAVIFLAFLCTQCSAQICEVLEGMAENLVTPKCMDQLMIMCNNPYLLFRMFDASSKYPTTGMSYSNNQDLGNYDECININFESMEGNVKGQYCGLSVVIVNLFLEGAIPVPFKLNMKPKSLAQIPTINYTRKADLRRFKDDLPKNVSITTLSLCIPDQCTPPEVGKFFIFGLFDETHIVNFVDILPCMTKDSNTTFKWGDILFITVLSIILFLIVWCTAYDLMLLKMNREAYHPILLSFSFITNGKKLLHISHSTSPDQIQCLNGIRFISMMWVISGHGFVAMESLPLLNYAEVIDYFDNVKAMYGGAAPIAVDTFFFLSGFLLTFGFLKSAAKRTTVQQVNGVPLMIIHRYLRVTPALAMLYFTAITIFRMTGTGPFWGLVATQMREQCENHWWSFFLYIQNYHNYDDMCLNHTWYLSADMQMFVLAPLVLIPLAWMIKNNRTNQAMLGLCVLTVLSLVIPIGIRFADFSIVNVYETHSRFNNILIGMMFGVVMRDSRFQKFPFHKLTNLAVWCVVIIIDVAFIIYYHSVVRIWDHTSDTLFYQFYRPIWCLSLAWMVYSCCRGYGGPVNWLLSLPVFQIGARLSYCMYLVHAIVEMYWVGLVRTQYYWGDYQEFYNWCGHFVVTMILSVFWSLAFESPMIVIEKFMFGGLARPKKPSQS